MLQGVRLYIEVFYFKQASERLVEAPQVRSAISLLLLEFDGARSIRLRGNLKMFIYVCTEWELQYYLFGIPDTASPGSRFDEEQTDCFSSRAVKTQRVLLEVEDFLIRENDKFIIRTSIMLRLWFEF